MLNEINGVAFPINTYRNETEFSAAFTDAVAQAVQRTFVQGERSFIDGLGCQYDDGCGNRCAVGHMMSDTEAKYYSGFYANVTDPELDEWAGRFSDNEVNFLDKLQSCHDQAFSDFRVEFYENLEIRCMTYDWPELWATLEMAISEAKEALGGIASEQKETNDAKS